jgi:hypothetical protein
MTTKKPLLDLTRYTLEQILIMCLCPVNRWATKEEHGWCSDNDLMEHPEWLFNHFEKNGGAEAFAKRRAEFTRLCDEIENCIHGETCELARRYGESMHCPIKNKKDHCMNCQKIKESVV